MRFRLLHYVLAGLLLLPSLPARAQVGGEDATTRNVGFKVSGEEVEIYYDLISSAGRVQVTVVLKKRFDKTYLYRPVAVSGDVGPSVIPGENRRITWKLSSEFPKGLPGEDCFFVVETGEGSEAPGGISTVVWIVGGAVVLGGVLTAVLLSKSKTGGDGGGGGIPGSDFPIPPKNR